MDRAVVEELLRALKAMYELYLNANRDAFSNGVTDPTGSIDEGDEIAARIAHEAESAITAAERELNKNSQQEARS